jgi:uncharacterized protein YjbI with pentapeptide repeats
MTDERLRADCTRCSGLCCVAPAFTASADFAIDKPAGRPCPHLAGDFRCGIHERLRPEGFPGCAVYDCFGAGQQIVQVIFGGRDWRTEDDLAAPMFAALPVVRAMHELLWHLAERSNSRQPRLADLTGADTRGARLAGTDLTGALFVTQSQLEAATGDGRTRLPRSLSRPAHWPGNDPPSRRS